MKIFYFLAIFVIASPATLFGNLIADAPEVTKDATLEDKSISFEFTLRNDGDLDIALDEVRASCPCVEIVDPPKTISAGGEVTMYAVLTPNPLGGKQVHQIMLRESNSERPLLLRIVARVPAIAEVNPKTLFWKKGTDPTPKAIELIIDGSRKATISDIYAMDENYRTTVEKTDSGTHIIHVTPVNTDVIRPALVMILIETPEHETPLRIGIPCRVGESDPFAINFRPRQERSPDMSRIENNLGKLQLTPNLDIQPLAEQPKESGK